jgi:hypothetical protein
MKFFFTLIVVFPLVSFSQIDSSLIMRLKALDTANLIKNDTLAVADDALSTKIKLLRSERRGLTPETIIRIKIMEEQQKDTTHSKEYYNKLLDEVTKGRTSKLIDNSLVNVYRRSFTEKEIDELIAFYKTSAGKKMDKEYLLLLVQSVKDLEQLLKLAVKNITDNK